MKKLQIMAVAALLCMASGCSPRDFLTRRLAHDLIAGSDVFKTTQQFWLRTGVISNKDYMAPEYLVLQRRGWITGASVPCAAATTPRAPATAASPCWDVALTPLGVETFRDLIPHNSPPTQYFSVAVARRELTGITGISKDGGTAEVDFQWKWVPMNEVGAALYASGVQYSSTALFRHYDDGWRVAESSAKSSQSLDDALKNAEPAP